jgi:hypothetical protein
MSKSKSTKKKAARKPSPKKPAAEAALCHCGCGEPVAKGRSFRQGHDARFHGRVAKLADGRLSIEDLPGLGVKPYAVPFYLDAEKGKPSSPKKPARAIRATLGRPKSFGEKDLREFAREMVGHLKK